MLIFEGAIFYYGTTRFIVQFVALISKLVFVFKIIPILVVHIKINFLDFFSVTILCKELGFFAFHSVH